MTCMLYILVYVLLFKRNVLFVSIFTILTNTLFVMLTVVTHVSDGKTEDLFKAIRKSV
jgi:5-bromo-4-chloroindolyl phosphate hydrolysis protein